MLFNVVTVILAAAAVLVSVYSILRQSRLARTSKDLDFAVHTLIEYIREKDFQNDQHYVMNHLACTHDPALGIDSLPKGAREAAWHVVFMYETVGMVLALGMVDRRIILSMFNYRIRQTWEVLAPYIRAERQARGAPYVPFFENAYREAIEADPATIYAELKLKKTSGNFWRVVE